MALQRHYNTYKSFFDAQVLKLKAGEPITGALPMCCLENHDRKEVKREGGHDELDPDIILLENYTPPVKNAVSETPTTPSGIEAPRVKRPPVTEDERRRLIRFLASATGGPVPSMEGFAKLVRMSPIVTF
jgi:hypothetical protein